METLYDDLLGLIKRGVDTTPEMAKVVGVTTNRIRSALGVLERRGRVVVAGTKHSRQGTALNVYSIPPSSPRIKSVESPGPVPSVFHLGPLISRDRAAWDAMNGTFIKEAA